MIPSLHILVGIAQQLAPTTLGNFFVAFNQTTRCNVREFQPFASYNRMDSPPYYTKYDI